MKNIKKHLAVALISMSTMVFIACNSNSNKSNKSNSGNSESNSSTQQEQTKVEDNIDGVYFNGAMQKTVEFFKKNL